MASVPPPMTLPPPAVSSSPLTRDLERLDAFEIAGTANPPAPVDTSSCSGFHHPERPPESLAESLSWQRLSPSSDATFVFSAHYDTRWRPVPLIQIVGISSTEFGAAFCRMWFSDSSQPVYIRATVTEVGETHGRRFDIYS